MHATEQWYFTPCNATHLVELAYVFNTSLFGENFTAPEFTLAADVISMWNSFHLYGNPNVGNPFVNWSSYQPNSTSTLSIQMNRQYHLIEQPVKPLCPAWLEVLAAERSSSFTHQ